MEDRARREAELLGVYLPSWPSPTLERVVDPRWLLGAILIVVTWLGEDMMMPLPPPPVLLVDKCPPLLPPGTFRWTSADEASNGAASIDVDPIISADDD